MSEHIVLANCNTAADVASSEAAYFSGNSSSEPTEVSVYKTPLGETVLWACHTIHVQFSDTGVLFDVVLGPDGANASLAGMGSNGFDKQNGGFRCWQKNIENYYWYNDKNCSMIYDCDHQIITTSSTIAQCTTSATVAAAVPTSTTSLSASTSNSRNNTTSPSAGAIIGISIGGGIFIIIAMAAFLFRKHSHARDRYKQRGGATEIPKSQSTTPRYGEEMLPVEVSHTFLEMDQQWRATEVQALSRPGELGGNAVAELPTPESHYYVFYGSAIDSAVSRSSIYS